MSAIGVVGGSGLYALDGLRIVAEERVETPFGDPSDVFTVGELEGVRVVFLARHGRGHRLLPTELNFRANIWAFKSLGVDTLISASAVGSMKLEYAPMDVVFPLQFIDRTRHRIETFFGDGVVAHVSLSDPVCAALAGALSGSAKELGARAHYGGTYICVEGPQFSTRAESMLYRSWGVDVIGMTNMQEARLAREAEICYVTMALVSDYDCWHETEAAVNVEQVIEYLRRNAETAASILSHAIPRIARAPRSCTCREALRSAILTPPAGIPARRRQELAPIIGKYIDRPN